MLLATAAAAAAAVAAAVAQLRDDPAAVAAVHCSDGCGRTGSLLACAALYLGHRLSAEAALALFKDRRFVVPAARHQDRPARRRGGGGGKSVSWSDAGGPPLSPGPAQVGRG